ncbi:MAG: hypothetical protein B7X91_08720 [Hydrogenophilales bacterium 17-64-11]|nr:MAG: hypothetical protein B7X91_08720 [Hydrogenophilales bacterium 17-64-11]
MLRLTELKLPLDHPPEALRAAILQRLELADDALVGFSIFKRSYDARKKHALLLIYAVDVEVKNEAALLKKFRTDRHLAPAPDMDYRFVGHAPENLRERPLVVGFGPCGIFAALVLAQMGFKPIVLERGKAVREREILYVSKPHIGTFRLVGMVEAMRHQIEALGGEIRFQQRVTDVLIEDGPDGKSIRGVTLASGETLASSHVVLALGHSARDTFEMLHARGVHMEAKPFSVGFRIEHPQSLIDRARLGANAGNPLLGAADYKLVHHAKNGRTVYSFCMCPGGTVVAAASEPNCVVTNGMSQYSRNERNANAGIVVGITPADFPGDDPLAGIELQRRLEARAFELGGGNYDAPGQLVGDFLDGKPSTRLGSVEPSYKPGVHLTDLASTLPDYAIEAIREALPAFDRQIKGFAMKDAVLTGVETRTSSPLRITRGDDCQSVNVKGLYPAGEGAGYAGGILSAGVDGIRVAEAVARQMLAETAGAKPL